MNYDTLSGVPIRSSGATAADDKLAEINQQIVDALEILEDLYDAKRVDSFANGVLVSILYTVRDVAEG